MKILKINFQIAATCVISVYCSKPEENEQLHVLIDPASLSSGLISSRKDGVLGKLFLPKLIRSITLFVEVESNKVHGVQY